jgi:hypothetical protein
LKHSIAVEETQIGQKPSSPAAGSGHRQRQAFLLQACNAIHGLARSSSRARARPEGPHRSHPTPLVLRDVVRRQKAEVGKRRLRCAHGLAVQAEPRSHHERSSGSRGAEGQPEFEEFKSKVSRLPESERAELLWLVSSTHPRFFKDLPQQTKSKQLREVLAFYLPMAKGEEEAIWERQRKRSADPTEVPDDERVEDAGLNDNVLEFPVMAKKPQAVARHANANV